MKKKVKSHKYIAIACSVIALMLTGCQQGLFSSNSPTNTHSFPKPPTPEPQPMAEIFFAVTVPDQLRPGESLVLSILDEVTGLALNPSDYVMQVGDNTHYYIALPFAVNSVVKYRYEKKGGEKVLEDKYDDKPVRYRLYYVGGPGEVMDTVASWSDSTFNGATGRITGKVVNSSDGSGLPDIMISAGGNQTLSDSNGDFVLEGIVEGTHNLVAYSLDGRYQSFQQGATIISGRRTPVEIRMNPAPMVNVVFTVIVPNNTVPTAPIRLAGNLLQLGNSFGDLLGGISDVAVDMPVLTPMLDGRFTLSMMLPAGADIRYKYTLGDGFWNAEHETNENFTLRQLIVPGSGGVIQDYIETWQAGSSAPILFEVAAPTGTPSTDIVSIQFNPYGWTEPIQMWPLGNNRWVYKLFSPLNLLGSFEYRYCRNDQCGSADDSFTAGNSKGRTVSTSLTPQDIKDTISSWNWYSPSNYVTPQQPPVQSRDPGFLAGVELEANYSHTWKPWMSLAFQNIQGMGSNIVVLSPTWTFQKENPLIFGIEPGYDPLGSDVGETISKAQALNLKVALFPQANFPQSSTEWWVNSPRDVVWWDSWFARYRAFAIYYADLAMENKVQMLVLGGDWLEPALPGGVLTDGSNSNLPLDAEIRWSSLVAEIRQHFNGQIYWALPYPGGLASAPGVINELDGIYLLWYASITDIDNSTSPDMQIRAELLLDTEVLPMQKTFQKPLIVAIAYPSIKGTAKACISDGGSGCLGWSSLNRPYPVINSVEIDMKAQEDAYMAMLNAINTRNWVTGFISRGYYPPVSLQDMSASINGKLTSTLLQYWYPSLLGIIK
jgi:hypothetical protein